MERAGRTSRPGAAGQSNGSGPAVEVEPDFVLQWGNRKRLRCVKIHVKNEAPQRASARDPNLRRRASSPRRLPGYNTRRSEASVLMKAQQQPGNSICGCTAPNEGARGSKKTCNGTAMPTDVASMDNGRKASGGEGGSSSSGGDATVWPNFVIALTTKEKEEDFLAFKGTKLPQRPKKRAKFVQRTLNQVSPGTWLCDLTLDRYEVREKKVSKKQAPTGLKAMGSLESESE